MAIDRDAEKPGGTHSRWMQSGWWRLAIVPLAAAMVWGFFVWWYPFSVFGLFYATVFALVVLVPIWLIAGKRFSAAGAFPTWFVMYVAFTFFGSEFTDPREYGRRTQCASNLHQVMLAVLHYEERYGCFPPAYVADAKGRPMHSWRVLILPMLEHKDVYDRYRFDEPWDGPNNRQLMSKVIPEYHCPSQGPQAEPMTSFVAVVGPTTAWPGATSTNLKSIIGRTADTILVVEMADSGIHWMEPRDLDIAAMAMSVNPADGVGVSSHHRAITWDRRLLGTHVAMANAVIEFLPTDTPEERLRALLTIAEEPLAPVPKP